MTYDHSTIEFQPLPTSSKFIDMTHRVFGRWKVLGFAGIIKQHKYWWCKCTCSALKLVEGGQLRSGNSTSCGCFRDEIRPTLHFVHGFARKGHPKKLYEAFFHAKSRCNDKNNSSYQRYGGRGIEFRFKTFIEFATYIGEAPTNKHSLDRFPNNNGHYEIGNVRWATRIEQARNQRSNRMIEFNGERRSVAEWCEKLHLVGRLIYVRLWRKWCDTCALTLPLGAKCPHH